jgi:HK97 gp10 family phage protein
MSVNFQIEIDYADQLAEALQEVMPDLLAKYVADAVKTVADRMLEDARRFVPVRTGYLLSTIALETDLGQFAYALVAKAPYAGYVEWGTRRMAARHYMRRAVEAHESEMPQEIMNAVIQAAESGLSIG